MGYYVAARRTRFQILIRQYLSSVGWQALVHSSLIGTAGWLLSTGQLTLGQLVAAEVIVGSLLINFDSVVKRMGYVFYFLNALTELDFLFSLPRDTSATTVSVTLPDPRIHGLRLMCKDLSFSFPGSSPEFAHFNLDVSPGEKIAIFSNTSRGKPHWRECSRDCTCRPAESSGITGSTCAIWTCRPSMPIVDWF